MLLQTLIQFSSLFTYQVTYSVGGIKLTQSVKVLNDTQIFVKMGGYHDFTFTLKTGDEEVAPPVIGGNEVEEVVACREWENYEQSEIPADYANKAGGKKSFYAGISYNLALYKWDFSGDANTITCISGITGTHVHEFSHYSGDEGKPYFAEEAAYYTSTFDELGRTIWVQVEFITDTKIKYSYALRSKDHEYYLDGCIEDLADPEIVRSYELTLS